jgi:hypothetical protein
LAAGEIERKALRTDLWPKHRYLDDWNSQLYGGKMTDDFSAPKDTQDTPSPSTVESGLSQEGIKAMRGPIDQPKSPAEQPPETPQLETPHPEAPQPEAPPEHTPKTVVGEAGLAELIESGVEKTEKEIFYGYGRGPERGW